MCIHLSYHGYLLTDNSDTYARTRYISEYREKKTKLPSFRPDRRSMICAGKKWYTYIAYRKLARKIKYDDTSNIITETWTSDHKKNHILRKLVNNRTVTVNSTYNHVHIGSVPDGVLIKTYLIILVEQTIQPLNRNSSYGIFVVWNNIVIIRWAYYLYIGHEGKRSGVVDIVRGEVNNSLAFSPPHCRQTRVVSVRVLLYVMAGQVGRHSRTLPIGCRRLRVRNYILFDEVGN